MTYAIDQDIITFRLLKDLYRYRPKFRSVLSFFDDKRSRERGGTERERERERERGNQQSKHVLI